LVKLKSSIINQTLGSARLAVITDLTLFNG